MNIGIDMMGGDFAPSEAVKGLDLYLSSAEPPADLYCIGNESQLKLLLSPEQLYNPHIITIYAQEIVGMHEQATRALKDKKESSLAVGFKMLATSAIDAFISAGNTGAMLVGALYNVKPVSGIHRPAIASILPKLSGKTGILLDVGLNADCKPENLHQFAVLGSLYAEKVFGIKQPSIGLLNVGEEEGKGNLLVQAAYALLQHDSSIRFIGNIEGRDLFNDKADVIVCEGFTGNVILKMAESLYSTAIVRNIEDSFMHRFNYEIEGGSPILGIAKPVIIGHGISNATAFSNMIKLAEKMVASNFCNELAELFTFT